MKINIKQKILFFIILFIFMVLIPLIAVRKNKNNSVETLSLNTAKIHNYKSNKKLFSKYAYFEVLDEHTNKILKIPEQEMIYAAVASEMPALFETEAIKAQAVASYTYFCYLRNSKPKEQKYDFKINSQKCINFISKEQMVKNWGPHFDKYYEKIQNATDSIFGKQIVYNGSPIFAAYHAISSGKTEKSSDIFGGDLPYLQNVESEGDKLAKGYETKIEFSNEEFNKILFGNGANGNFCNTPENFIKNYERTPAGTVKKVLIGSKEFRGTDIRNLFNLRSANFVIDYLPENQKFRFTTFGYGHGVGMSQCGANYMAKQGKKYEEILAHYYPGTELI